MFHDLGLTAKYRRTDQRFEIDGADEARRFLLGHGIAEEAAMRVWTGIALHTTPEILLRMAPEIAPVTRGVELDVLGIGYHAITDEQAAAVVAAHPRPDFKRQILEAFTEGIAGRPETTFGNVKADVLEHFLPGFRRGDFVEEIQNSGWPEYRGSMTARMGVGAPAGDRTRIGIAAVEHLSLACGRQRHPGATRVPDG